MENPAAPTGAEHINKAEVWALAKELKRLLWAGPEIQAIFQAVGVQVTPSSFYANIPSLEDLDASFEYAGDADPYADSPVFDEARMVEFLAELQPYAAEFNPPRAQDPAAPHQFYWDNLGFSHSDAMAYYCVIRHLRPARVIEVGSGLSTLVASQAIEDNGCGEILVVEPYPKDFLRDTPHVSELIEEPVQSVGAAWFRDNLDDGDVFFIDSTHTVKTGSDCLHLYLRVLPALRSRVMVHAHDIFLPEAMPIEWARDKHIYWTEQYLLLALLTGNPSLQARLGIRFLERRRPDVLQEFMGGKSKAGGGSFWFTANAEP